MKAAPYTRVSTAEQAKEGYSLAAQEKLLRDYCRLKKLEIYDVYSDEGISAKDIAQRPGLMRLMNDARERKFEIVLVWKLTRFSRNLKDLLNLCDELESYGIYLHSYSESFDGKTPTGRLMRGVIGLMAQFEREVLSENVRLGLDERASRGLRTCTNVLGYDVTRGGGICVNQQEAEIVRFIWQSYIERKCMLEVAALCREKGYRGKRGRSIRAQSVFIILTRFLYAGYYSWHGQPIKATDGLVPLVTAKEYNRVQALLNAQGKLNGRKRVNTKIVYLRE